MKTYTFIIGSTDDFESIDELMEWAEAESKHEGSICRNAQIWEFDCPADCSEEIVTMMGRGYAFSSDWCMDDTVSFMVDGPLDPDSIQTQMQMHDLWESPNGTA